MTSPSVVDWGPFVDGAWQGTDDGTRFSVVEPSTGRELALVRACGAAAVDEAVTAARRAFESDWRDRPVRDRARLLREVAEIIAAHADELAELRVPRERKASA